MIFFKVNCLILREVGVGRMSSGSPLLRQSTDFPVFSLLLFRHKTIMRLHIASTFNVSYFLGIISKQHKDAEANVRTFMNQFFRKNRNKPRETPNPTKCSFKSCFQIFLWQFSITHSKLSININNNNLYLYTYKWPSVEL